MFCIEKLQYNKWNYDEEIVINTYLKKEKFSQFYEFYVYLSMNSDRLQLQYWLDHLISRP